jgi:hypothetical protein
MSSIAQTRVNGGPCSLSRLDQLVMADQQPGSDAGARIEACLAAVHSSGGGVCDAREFLGSQTIAESALDATPSLARR